MRVRVTAVGSVLLCCLAGLPAGISQSEFELRSAIVFTSTRDAPTIDPNAAAEIYLMNGDGTDPRRLTENTAGEAFAALSPDGKKIVFDSNRNMRGEIFLMDTDGSYQTLLTRGSSATWSPDGKNIAFHASASGTGLPTRPDPGAPTSDSDIFVLNVDDVLAGAEEPRNLTNSPDYIDDDADWSPDGQRFVFTSHPVTDDPLRSNLAEIYTINVDGTEQTRLTFNAEEERAASWSPDGARIVFMCRIGGGASDFEICVMNADGTGQVQLTDNTLNDATATFSPDGQQIVFHRPVAGRPQLWLMNADGSGQVQLTNTAGVNIFANWGVLRVHSAP